MEDRPQKISLCPHPQNLGIGPHLEIGSLQVELKVLDEVILDQLCHPHH
jgi:hypothetical protein